MSRVYNFSAGPAVLPEEVLKEVAAEMLDYNGTGILENNRVVPPLSQDVALCRYSVSGEVPL